MNRFAKIVLAAALGAGLPAMAMAQDYGRNHEGGGRGPHGYGGGQGRERGNFGGAPQAQPAPQAQAPQSFEQRRDFNRGPGDGRDFSANRFQGNPEGRPEWRREGNDRRFAGNDNDRRWDNDRQDNRRWDNDRRDDRRWDNNRFENNRRFDDNRRWADNRGGNDRWVGSNWRNDRRYDWRGYRTANRGAFHVGRYVPPRNWGYGYRRFSIGGVLPSFFWGSDYWLDDPYAYRLPPAYGPYRWVRYYDDVLLIDVRTGRVVDMIPDFFW